MLRCPSCATVTWQLLAHTNGDLGTCPTCGTPMRSERRRPGRRGAAVATERRGAPYAPARRRALDMSAG
jgi:uncharacterized paraquat-inducible protein A